MKLKKATLFPKGFFLCFIFLLGSCPEPGAPDAAALGGPCLHGVYCESGMICEAGICIEKDSNENTDAGAPHLTSTQDAGTQVSPDVFEICSALIGTWNINIESDGEATCGQDPTTQPYDVFINAQGELEAKWDTTAGADEAQFDSEFLLIDGECALKNDSVFIIHAPAMNEMPATTIQADYHYTVVANELDLSGNGTMHFSTTVVETGEAQQDCTQDIVVSGHVILLN